MLDLEMALIKPVNDLPCLAELIRRAMKSGVFNIFFAKIENLHQSLWS